MSLLLNSLKTVRDGSISTSYLATMVCIDELGGEADVHDLSKMLEQTLPILRTNLTRMSNAGWCKKVDVNKYIPTNKWVALKKDIYK